MIAPVDLDTAVVAAVERRVLWLATAIVHHANPVSYTHLTLPTNSRV